MNTVTLQPLLAAGGIEAVFYVIVFIFWIVSQLFGNRKAGKQKKQPQPRPQPVDRGEDFPLFGNNKGQERGQANQPPNQEDALRSEVEDFLRRAQGKPPKPKPQPMRQQKSPQPPEPQRKRLVAPVRKDPLRQKNPLRQKEPTLRSEGVAEHVSRHISTQDIAAHTQTLGAEVATADDVLEARLHETFDHEVGRLEHRDMAAKHEEVDMAANMAAMLRSPEGMRQLIIANEILRRPEW